MSKSKGSGAASGEPVTLEGMNKILTSLASQFSTFTTKIGSLDNIGAKVDAMETRMAAMEAKLVLALEENKKLRASNVEKDKIIADLQTTIYNIENKTNYLEQYNRSWSVRVLNIPLTDVEEKDPIKLRDKVFTLAFLPILQGALERGVITSMPDAAELLEIAHVLPGKPGANKPIITRFYNRFMRTLCLRFKKDLATRSPARRTTRTETREGPGPDERGRIIFPFSEDLTFPTFTKMRALNMDSRVQACWSVNGQLRYKLANSEVVHKVQCVLDTVDAILA
jgi:hypothetical protein